GKIISAKPAETDGLISDKARFCLDGLSKNRIDRPYKRINGRLTECSWTEALTAVAEKMKTISADKMAGLIGEYADCESMLALRDLFALKGANAIDARPDGMYFDTHSRQSWLFNTPFSRICEADALLCVGADVDALAPAVAWRLRQNPMPKGFVGKKTNSCLPYEALSNKPVILEDILNDLGRGAALLRQARKPMIIVGASVMQRSDAAAIMRLICQISQYYSVIREDWNGYNFLTDKTTVLGALELGLIPEEPLRPKMKSGRFDLIYLLNEDRFQRSDAPEAFVVYQGIYASDTAREADVVLPSLSFAEKKATYVNAEGRAQSTAVALPAFGQAREDWKILRALSEYLETAPLPYNDLDDIRDALAGKSIVFYSRGEIHKAENKEFGVAGKLSDEPIDSFCDSFADELSRQSEHAKMLRWRSR
ncbi:MAG: molybdopterin-dependent oxidoreductase, partial [Alphaproteobacteria bacterium]|nr:molybdopterin-dependent oxidoreductase [Alphaproteobacteria bacterium]